MFFVKGKGLLKDDQYGRLYVFKITLDSGEIVHKVGMCFSDRATDRMLEVLRSFYMVYRYVPRCEIRRDKKVLVPKLVEKHMHDLLEELSYTFDKSFDGCTEFFNDVDEEPLLEYLDSFEYREMLAGKIEMKTEDLDAIRAAMDTQDPPKTELGDDDLPF